MTVLLLTIDQLGDKALNDALGLRDYAQAVSEEVLRLTEALRKAERQRDSLARRCAVRFEESQRLERELADINSRVAEDERVFAAVGAYVAQTRQLMRSHFEPGARALELMAAWEARAARRALGHTAPSDLSEDFHSASRCGEAGEPCPGCVRESQQLTHNEGTLRKVYDALGRAGLTEQQSIDAINDMQNNGLYFREAGHPAPSGWVADHQPEQPSWLIWSYKHNMWWRPARAGYTNSVVAAGQYTKAEAERIADWTSRSVAVECPDIRVLIAAANLEAKLTRDVQAALRAVGSGEGQEAGRD